MKKSDKIIGTIAVVAIFLLVIYLIESHLIIEAPKEALFAVVAIFSVAIYGVISQYLIIGLILRSRVSVFKKIAKKYSLEHSSVSERFFIPNGELNCLKGIINGIEIKVIDEQFSPDTILAAETSFKIVAFPGRAGHAPRKSLNMRTKIIIDGLNKTPKYKQPFIFYRNPFLKVSEIEKCLENLS